MDRSRRSDSRYATLFNLEPLRNFTIPRHEDEVENYDETRSNQVANYGNGVKKRKRWIEEAGDDDDDHYNQHITEEHYRSMLEEHVQRLKSSSRESQGNHTSLMRKSNVGSYRGNGQRGRFYDADAISQGRGSYRGSAITPKIAYEPSYLDIGNGVVYKIPPSYDKLVASLNLPSFSDLRVEDFYLRGALDLRSLEEVMASVKRSGVRSRNGMGEPRPQYESLQARVKALSASNSNPKFSLKVSEDAINSVIPEGAAGSTARTILSEGGVLQVHYVKVLEKGDTYEGPEIRTGFLKDGKPIQLKQGQEITISTDYDLQGDEETICMSYKKLAEDVNPGMVILCADGTISLLVLSCDTENGTVRCRCENSAMLGERKNVNLPGVVVDLPTLTEKDKEDIMKWGVPNQIDMIALSFVRKGSDLVQVRKLLGDHAKNILLMSKVENQEGVANFDDILVNSDAFMIARGDLGMEIPIEKIFLAQKVMIYKCNIQGKPVVTATQMLESMIKSPRPTRAEATDVANAVLDGTDCVMLSGETAAGAYPELAVRTMAKICVEAESTLDYGDVFKRIMQYSPVPMSPLESLASSAVRTANSARATLIMVLTRGGSTARLVAKYRPGMPILSVVVPEMKTDFFDWSCSDESPARHSLIFRGLIPVLYAGSARASHDESTEEAIEFATQHGKEKQLCKTGDSVVALLRVGNASLIKILTVK